MIAPWGQVAKSTQEGARLNVLKMFDPSLRFASSGMRRWTFFCDLTGRQYFSPTEEGGLAWPSCFGAGGSFRIYVAHLGKACWLLGVRTAWKD